MVVHVMIALTNPEYDPEYQVYEQSVDETTVLIMLFNDIAVFLCI